MGRALQTKGEGCKVKFKDLYKSYGISPRKRFGQNFLTDKNIANKIVRLADIKSDDVVLEIGSGIGALTDLLVETGAKIIAVEIDRTLFSILSERFSCKKNIKILNDDALKISYKDMAARFGKKLKVVSNLPYNISTPILFKFLDERQAFSSLVLMLQKEVAERIAAKPSCKDYGVLSVFVQMFMGTKVEFRIPPSAFYPNPKVYSSVLMLDVLDEPRAKIDDTILFKSLVNAAFNQRRKTLSNALKGLAVPHDVIVEALGATRIDPGRRGETLSIEEFARLCNCLTMIKK
ncbi:MAG: 16S rRNA (adenine(1518)-N(6)/adenine(1519)-N(6))-dimethyltransferase RsmA [Deltaproteobacteria bacterium]|nr:16S rRNA (adenine(1518)-N(6)/adenine(1519)-N(6))-dimethyltransferase RsmA [Deltaproteobacteria bacterium]